MSPRSAKRVRQIARYTNSSKRTIDFVMEPWGDIVKMPAGVTYEITVEGPEDGELETDFADDHITVWAWMGSTMRVTSDGEEIADK